MNDVSPLVVTPLPLTGESLYGFLLRTVEDNGYSSIGEILRYAGMTENELRSVRPPFEKLAVLYGYSPEMLKSLAYYQTQKASRNKGFGILGHPLNVTQAQIKNPKFCPECAKETGHISVFWDISYAVACPVHARRPMISCPNCESDIKWRRPGLYTCSCEYDLAAASIGRIEDQNLLALMEVLRRKLFRLSLDSEIINQQGMPVSELDGVSLRTLLSIIDRFGKSAETAVMATNKKDWEFSRASVAASALADWPNGFYRFLRSINENVPDAAKQKYFFGLRKQFEVFYTSLFKTHIPKREIEFIHEAFVKFGDVYWKKAVIDPRLRTDANENNNICGIGEMAKHIGVMPSTVKKLIQEGILKPNVINTASCTRYLFDINEPCPKKALSGKSYSSRVAAKLLGIPESVLRELRVRGIYKTMRIGSRIAAFHEGDIKDFRNKVLNKCAPSLPGDDLTIVTLDQVMKMRLRSIVRKVAVIEGLLNEDLRAFVCHDDSLRDIQFNRDELDVFLLDTLDLGRKNITTHDAAQLLHCDHLVIPWLAHNGYVLQSDDCNNKISASSVRKFKEKYVSCASLAKTLKRSPQSLVKQYESEGRNLIFAERGNDLSLQVFVERKRF